MVDVTAESMPGEDLVDPITGEVINKDDTDALIDALESISRIDQEVYQFKMQLRALISAKAQGDAKTRRVAGLKRTARIVMPDTSWDQSLLKEAWNSYPQWRDKCLQIGTIRVRMREWKKIIATSGPDDFETFKGMIHDADRGPTGMPQVKVEV